MTERDKIIKQSENKNETSGKALLEKIALLENIIERASDVAILATDLDFRIIYYNPMAEKLYGYKKGDVLGKTVMETHTREKVESERFEKAIKEVREKGEYCYTVKQETEKGERYLEARVRDILDTEGKPVGFSLFSRDITEKIKTDKVLIESEKRYRTLFELLPYGGEVIDTKGYIKNCSPSTCKLLGYNSDELIGKHITEILDSASINTFKAKFPTLLQGKPHDAEISMIRKDGNKRSILRAAQPILNDESKVTAILALNVDITDRNRALEKEKESEKSYHSIFDNASDAIYIQDKNEIFLDVNQGVVNMYGYPKEFFIGNTPEPLSAPGMNDLLQIGKYIEKAFKGESQQFEFWGKRKNGEIFPKIVRLNKGTYFGKEVIFAFALDITEQKHFEEKLKRASSQWRSTFDAMNDSVALLDLDGKIVLCNKAMVNFAGKPFAELIGSPYVDVFRGNNSSQEQCPYHRVQKSLKRETQTININNKWIEMSVDPEFNEKNQLIGFVHIMKDITESKHTEQALRENEVKYRLLFEEANDAIFLMKGDVFVDCNQKTLEIFGCTKNQIIGKPPYMFSPPKQYDGSDSKTEALKKINRALNEESLSFEWLHNKYDKTPFDAEVSLNSIELAGEQYIQAIVRDITDRKRAEEALQENETKYRNLIENSNDAIYLLYNRKFEIINDKFEQMFGLTLKNMNDPDFDFINLVARESRSLIEDRFKRSAKGETLNPNYEFTAIMKNGNKIEVETSVSYIKYKDGVASQGIIRDITERKKAREELQHTHQIYQESIKNVNGVPYHFILPDNFYKFVGQGCEELTGIPAKEFTVKKWKKLIQQTIIIDEEAPQDLQEYSKLFLSGKMKQYKVDLQIKTPTGKTKWISDCSLPIKDKDTGEVIGSFGILLDINERKNTEEQLKDSLEEKVILIKEIHHRVKNNLNVVTSLLNTQSRLITDKKAIQAFKDSVSRIYTMSQVHNQLYRSNDLSNVDMKKYIQAMAKQAFINYRPHRNITMELDIDEIKMTIDGSIPLGLLLNEMISNALKHGFPNSRSGKVRISMKELPDKQCELIVQDDGVGIPENVNFDTIESLGLHLINILTAQLEGKMELVRENGTKFIIKFMIK